MLRASFVLEPTHAVHLGQTFAPLQRGHADPLIQLVSAPAGTVCWATAQEQGINILARFARLEEADLSAPCDITLWAPSTLPAGRSYPLSPATALEVFAEKIGGWVGENDRWSPFYQSSSWGQLPERLRQSRDQAPGLRIPSIGLLSQNVLLAISEQRVTGIEAMGGMRALLRQYGQQAPHTGYPDQPEGLLFFPPAEVFAQIPEWAYHRAGFDRSRSSTMVHYARRAASFERFATESSLRDLAQALVGIPGIGPWTVAETLQRYCGHPDAISVGDYHLAHQVTYAFDGVRGDDQRMLELLAPFAGNRQRVVTLIKAAGIHEPRQAPRYAPQDFRSF